MSANVSLELRQLARVFLFLMGFALQFAHASELQCADPFSFHSVDASEEAPYVRSPLELELSFPIFREGKLLELWKTLRSPRHYQEENISEMIGDQQARRKVLEHFQLGDLSVAPGHQAIRSKQTFDQLVLSYKLAGPQKRFYEPLLLNMIVKEGTLKSVDIWDGHHRFLALLVAGYKTIGELRNFSIMFLVNGSPSEGSEPWSHYLPQNQIAFKVIENWSIGSHFDERHKTQNVKFSGERSNSELGSMISLSGLKKLLLTQRRIAWIWLRSTQSIQDVLSDAEKLQGWDEVLLVAGHLHLSQVEIQSLERTIASHKKINVTFHSKWFDRLTVAERIREIYSTSIAAELEY